MDETGQLTELRQLCSDIAQLEAEQSDAAARMTEARNRASELVAAMGGSVAVPGFGTLLISKPAISFDAAAVDALLASVSAQSWIAGKLGEARRVAISYEGSKLRELLTTLQAAEDERATALAAARKMQAGGLRIVREK